jgi:NAD(P)-dependent dehydrogenase (short-subunit alcohol dehydrogenase family)
MPPSETPQPRALITGAARRIGRAIALSLAEAGYDIGVHYHRSRDEADGLVAQIAAFGRQSVALQADLADAAAVARLVPMMVEQLGAPTCLINNASEFRHDSIQTVNVDSWALHQDINLRAPIMLSQALFLNLPEGAQGNVINIIDQRVLRLTPEFFSYTISKAGLWTATTTLAQALSPRVRVNAIGPGPVLRSVHQTEAEFDAEQSSTLLGRGSTPEEIAAAVRFLLSAPAITGQMIVLDGGQHLAWS